MAGARIKNGPASDMPPLSDSEEDYEGWQGGKWVKCKKKGKRGKKQTSNLTCGGGREMCGKQVSEDDNSIRCEACGEWYHLHCQGISAGAFQAIRKFDLFWMCNTCQTNVKEKVQTEKVLEAKIADSEKNILSALKAYTEAKKTEHRLEEKLKAMEQEVINKLSEQCANVEIVLGQQKEVVEETKKTYSEIAQKSLGPLKSETVIAESVTGKISEVMLERAEIEKRQLNLIVHGLPETSPAGAELSDREAFESLCLEKLKVEGIQYKQVARLGSKTPSLHMRQANAEQQRPWIRPLRVELSDATSRLKILRALPKLREEGSTTYITADKTPKHRAEKVLEDQCRKYNMKHTNETIEAYIKRGEVAYREKKVKT